MPQKLQHIFDGSGFGEPEAQGIHVMRTDFIRCAAGEVLQIVLVAILVRDNALEVRLVGLVCLPEAGDGPAPGKGGFLLAPDAAALGIGQTDAVHTLFADLGGLGGGHTLGFTADLFLDLFPVQPVHNIENLVRLAGGGIVSGLGARLSEHIKHADFFCLMSRK